MSARVCIGGSGAFVKDGTDDASSVCEDGAIGAACTDGSSAGGNAVEEVEVSSETGELSGAGVDAALNGGASNTGPLLRSSSGAFEAGPSP